MNTILFPIDFSPASINALEYGIELNKNIKSKIILFHCYFIPIPVSEAPIAMPSDLSIKNEAAESLNSIVIKYRKLFPEMTFNSNLVEGFANDEIISEIIKTKCDLVIMGMKEISVLKHFFIGSNTTKVLEKSTCPVLVVPENSRMKRIKKIIFAANYGIDDFNNVNELISFAKIFDSEIILLHISDNSENLAFDYNQLGEFKNKIYEESGFDKISFKVFENENTYEGINLYLEEINADLLSISTRYRTFIQNIFQSSLTKKMVYHTQLPILVFHTNL